MAHQISDGYGDPSLFELEIAEQAEFVIPRFEAWLHKLANYWTSYADHDDLVQEGRIAMWQSLKTFEADKGALASWVTAAAKMRMRDCIRRSIWTGMPSRKGKRFVPDTQTVMVFELMDDDESLETMLAAADLLEAAMLAYHRGEILQAISRLSPMQQRYVVLRFWLGYEAVPGQPSALKEIMGVSRPDMLWNERNRGARDRLRTDLEHLAVT